MSLYPSSSLLKTKKPYMRQNISIKKKKNLIVNYVRTV